MNRPLTRAFSVATVGVQLLKTTSLKKDLKEVLVPEVKRLEFGEAVWVRVVVHTRDRNHPVSGSTSASTLPQAGQQ
jgi:hypothetical protein